MSLQALSDLSHLKQQVADLIEANEALAARVSILEQAAASRMPDITTGKLSLKPGSAEKAAGVGRT